MVRTEQFKYIVYEHGRGREQLFDMYEDPGEMVDLSTTARYNDILERHRDLLLEWCIETGDIFAEHWERPGVPMIPGRDYSELPVLNDEQ